MGDVNGDGTLDVIASDQDAMNIYLLLGPNFKRETIATGTDTIHAQLLDMDADGDLDWVGVDYLPGRIYWLENPLKNPPEQPGWAKHVIDDVEVGGPSGLHAVIVVDVDADGRRDLVVTGNAANGEHPNSIVYYPIPDDPRNTKFTRAFIADGDAVGFVHYLGFGDIDADGRADIATGAKIGNTFAFWKAPSSSSERWTRTELPGEQKGATNIEVVDVNGDGHADLLASRGHGKGVLWFEGPTMTAHVIDDEILTPHSLAVGDMDADGDVDAVAVGIDSELVAWYANDGHGKFVRHTIATGQKSYDVRLIDVDADGDPDVFVAGQNRKNVIWFENPGARKP